MIRFESDGTATVVANEGTGGPHVRVGHEWSGFPEAGITSLVWRTGRAVRIDDYRDLPGGGLYVSEGLIGAVGVPIFVHGALWGLIAIGSCAGPLPADTEVQLAEFTNLTATAIATAQGRAEIETSRARIVMASDESRRRIERDLHDGAQQRLVALALRLATLSGHESVLPPVRDKLERTARDLLDVVDNLREIAQGLHPAILSEAGLGPALRALALRASLPVTVGVDVPSRLPQALEVGAYYVVSEALANVLKHSRATHADISAATADGLLIVTVADDGVGGAELANGTGLIGLRDRVEALGGELTVDSPAGGGTRIRCEIPEGGDMVLLAQNPGVQRKPA